MTNGSVRRVCVGAPNLTRNVLLKPFRCTPVNKTFDKRLAVLIVDHGSRRKQANTMLTEIVNSFREKSQFTIVEKAHMEIAKPSIPDAIHACVEQGAEHIVISPFFLSPGRHSQMDIPNIVKTTIAESNLDITYSMAQPVGTDPLIINLLQRRIENVLENKISELK